MHKLLRFALLAFLIGSATTAQSADLLVITYDNRIGVVQPPDYSVIRRSGQLAPAAGHTIHDLKSDPNFFDLANVLTRNTQGCWVYEIDLRNGGTQALNSPIAGPTPCAEAPRLLQRIFKTGGRIAGGDQFSGLNAQQTRTIQNASGTGTPDIVGFTNHRDEAVSGDYMLDRASNSLVEFREAQSVVEVVGTLGVSLSGFTTLSGGWFSEPGFRPGPLFMMTGGRAYELNVTTGEATERGALPPNTRVMAIDIHAPQRRGFGANAFDGGGDGGGGSLASLTLMLLAAIGVVRRRPQLVRGARRG